MRIESNLRGTVLQIIEDIQGDEFRDAAALRQVGLDIVAMVQTRVQQRGLGADGRLNSKSATRTGAYSKGYGKHRERRGRQTQLVDLTMDGDLWRAWQVIGANRREVTVGFINEKSGDIAEYLEAYYGDIFVLTEAEQRVIIADLIAGF